MKLTSLFQFVDELVKLTTFNNSGVFSCTKYLKLSRNADFKSMILAF